MTLSGASIALALVLTGCSSSSMSPGGMSSGDVAVTEPGTAVGAPETGGMMAVDGKSSVGSTSTNVIDRSTIETAYLAVSVSTPQSTVTDAERIATDAGGFVQDSSWNPANEYGPESAYLTIRVPVDQLDAVLSSLESLGTVDSLSRSKTDVTLAVTDLTARIASLQQSLDDLRALQAQATNVGDLITVESAISARQAELDSLLAQQTYLSDQVDMSTISVTLTGPRGTTPTNDTFWDGLVAGWNSLFVAGSALLVAIGFALPWIALLAIVAGVVLAVIFALIRRNRANGGASAVSKPSTPSTATTAPKTTTKK